MRWWQHLAAVAAAAVVVVVLELERICRGLDLVISNVDRRDSSLVGMGAHSRSGRLTRLTRKEERPKRR